MGNSTNKSISEHYAQDSEPKDSEQPDSDIDNENYKTHTRDGGLKKSHQVENQQSRKDTIDKKDLHRPRDNA